MTETINEAYIGWLHEKCYSGTSPKQVLTGPNILPALERCLPWRSFAWLEIWRNPTSKTANILGKSIKPFYPCSIIKEPSLKTISPE